MNHLLDSHISQLEDDLRDAQRAIKNLQDLQDASERQVRRLTDDLKTSRQERDQLRALVNERDERLERNKSEGDRQKTSGDDLEMLTVESQLTEKVTQELEDRLKDFASQLERTVEDRNRALDRCDEAERSRDEAMAKLKEAEEKRGLAEEGQRQVLKKLEEAEKKVRAAERRQALDEVRVERAMDEHTQAEALRQWAEERLTEAEETVSLLRTELREHEKREKEYKMDQLKYELLREKLDGGGNFNERQRSHLQQDTLSLPLTASPSKVSAKVEVIEIGSSDDEGPIIGNVPSSPSVVQVKQEMESQQAITPKGKERKALLSPDSPPATRRRTRASLQIAEPSQSLDKTPDDTQESPRASKRRKLSESVPVVIHDGTLTPLPQIFSTSASIPPRSCPRPQSLADTPSSLNARVSTFASLSISRPPSQSPSPSPTNRYPGFIRRDFLRERYGCTDRQFSVTITAARNYPRTMPEADRPLLFPLWESNPGMPSTPGQPGTLIANRYDMLGSQPVGMFVRAPEQAVWLYLGDYELKKSDRFLSRAEFKALPEACRRKWAKEVLRPQKWCCYTSMRARIWLRKNGRVLTDANFEIAHSKRRELPQAIGLEEADVLKALDAGEEKLNVIVCRPVSYDVEFQEDMANNFAIWNESKARATKTPNLGEEATPMTDPGASGLSALPSARADGTDATRAIVVDTPDTSLPNPSSNSRRNSRSSRRKTQDQTAYDWYDEESDLTDLDDDQDDEDYVESKDGEGEASVADSA
ncbi:hypothetical protein BV25DRAFT_1826167 [Artomyces pyxidatus]|uniref:Uncharacterized protein n=1 Tax=Artomyces pyxidatus TaxID=48021 RepID=A0ACB8T095_9AGAM|nr:hypothetical protein BV25DRAFT_1826167 [Artomyces pyxidatus]